MRVRAVLIASFLAVAAIAWLCFGAVLRSGMPRPALPPQPDAAQTPASGQNTPPDVARIALDLDQRGDLAPTRTVQIEAVFADDGRPAAGAEVLWCAADSGRQSTRSDRPAVRGPPCADVG